MYSFYSFLLTLGFCLMLPRFLFDFLRRGKYAAGFSQRLGYHKNFRKDGLPVLWVHCVSVGEANAALPIINEIIARYPNFRLVVSTTTATGQELAQKLYGNIADKIIYFPFDWKMSVRRVLRNFQPNIVLLMETELWFNFIREANKSGASVFLANGRLSEKSFSRYIYIRKFMSRVLYHITLALMQDKADAIRLKRLGIRANKVKITGNVKFDQNPAKIDADLTAELKSRFGFSENAPLIIAASTHEPEVAADFGAF